MKNIEVVLLIIGSSIFVDLWGMNVQNTNGKTITEVELLSNKNMAEQLENWTEEEKEDKLPEILNYYNTVYKLVFGESYCPDELIYQYTLRFFLDEFFRYDSKKVIPKCLELAAVFENTEFAKYLFDKSVFIKLNYRTANEDEYKKVIPCIREVLSLGKLREFYRKFCSEREVKELELRKIEGVTCGKQVTAI